MARKTKEEALKTRQAILDAAVRIFAIWGVSRTTLAQIAKEAGVTRGAIYWHFTNKEDMLNALWEQLLLPFQPITLASENPHEPDPLGKLKQTYLSFFEELKANPRLLQIYQVLINKCETVEDTGVLHLHRVDSYEEGRQIVGKILRNAIAQGQLPESFDVRLGSITTIAFIDGLISNCIMFPELLDVKREIPIMLDSLLEMLRSGVIQ